MAEAASVNSEERDSQPPQPEQSVPEELKGNEQRRMDINAMSLPFDV
jgi:hypothetical protein